MSTPFEMVRAFHDKVGLPNGKEPHLLAQACSNTGLVLSQLRSAEFTLRHNRGSDDVMWGRVQMMIEELRELVEVLVDIPALEDHEDRLVPMAAIADALVDLEYFALGTAAAMGLPHDEIFAAVNNANMQKERVASTEESRRLNKLDVKKPEGWQPADVTAIIRGASCK